VNPPNRPTLINDIPDHGPDEQPEDGEDIIQLLKIKRPFTEFRAVSVSSITSDHGSHNVRQTMKYLLPVAPFLRIFIALSFLKNASAMKSGLYAPGQKPGRK
jgi:hypothetical protein